MADTRIIDLPNQVTIGEGSFVAIDSDSDGTRKYDLAQIASVADANVISSMAERAAQIATEAAEKRIDDAIDAMGDISEIAVPLMSSDVRGGAKLGEGLALTDGALGIDPAPQQSTGGVRGSIASLTAKGHAEQDGTPTPESPVAIKVARGRNLIDESLIEQGSVGQNGDQQDAMRCRVSGMIAVSASETYVGSGVLNSGTFQYYIWMFASNGTYVHALPTWLNSGEPFTIVANVAYIRVVIRRSDNSNIVPSDIAWCQIELGSTPQPYVPYGHVGMEAQGRNRLDPSILISGNAAGVTYTHNGDGSFNVNGTSTGDASVPLINNSRHKGFEVGKTYTANIDFSKGVKLTFYSQNGQSQFGKTTPLTFTIPSNGNWNVSLVVSSGTTVTNAIIKPIIVDGADAADFAPYYHETRAIPLPSRGWVASLPDGTADVLTLDGAGKVTWKLNDAEVVLDGSESWISEGANEQRYNSTSTSGWNAKGGKPLLSDQLFYSGQIAAGNSFDGLSLIADGSRLRVRSAAFSTLEDWVAWLTQNPVTVLYPLATPVTEERGYVEDWPTDIPEGAVITIHELDALGVKYYVDGAAATLAHQWYERARSEYEDRIASLEAAVAELATS